ncbi:glutathione ABC transporter substrate-binding protein [Geomicrobium sp. JCM 19055]|uniref:glutathione ABC transporter substrate-binding protein n=1 Tax=Geomicrobium sp. JCM 19055 TaxID=1460649 RepID=UPI00045ECE6A|nr:glutathione ABC transporter substrate-binding protein [Geomicrobium sp. JCM 19055]GAK01406.1 oligopeptide ABC transporter, periplasmic oligopeptide-binding protein OppA [Geomicrobium sp. JCM 19055]
MANLKRYVAGFAGATVLLAGCSSDPGAVEEGSDGSTSTGSAGGDQFVLALSSDIVSLDPQETTDVPSSQVSTNIYENLLEHDNNMELQPVLAESYEMVDDLTWEFQIREGVTFHDGEELNADAVVKNFERLLDPDNAKPRANMFELVEEITAIDEYTVEFTTSEPFAPLDAHLAHSAAAIISPAAIDADENGDALLSVNAAGTGSFELDEWVQGNEIRLSKNENYWGEEAQVSQVTMRVVPEQSTRIGMLDQGEVHFIDQVESANSGIVDDMQNASLLTQEQLGFEYIGFNTDVEPFDDPDVRRAIAMAIDSEVLLEGLYGGFGSVATGPLSEYTFGYSEDTQGIEYDPEGAKELLAEAGYEDGFSASILTNDANPTRIHIAEVAQDYLQEVGVDLSIEMMEWGAFLDATDQGNTEMFVLGWSTVTADADYALHPNFYSGNHGSQGNSTFYDNEEVDALLTEARSESDNDARADLYAQAEQIIIEEAPMIFTVHNDYITGIADSVEGFNHLATGIYDLSEVSINEEEAGY